MSRLAKSVCPNVTLGLRLVWLLLGPPPVSYYSYCMSHIYDYTNKCFSYIEAVECYEKQHQQSATVQKEGCVAFVVYPCAFVILTIFIKSICTDSMGIKKHSLDHKVEFWVKGSKSIYPKWIFHLLEQHKYVFNVSIAPLKYVISVHHRTDMHQKSGIIYVLF